MRDGPPGGMDVYKRLQALRARKAAWAAGQFAASRTFPVSRHDYAFTGTHLAHLKPRVELEIIQIPCTITAC